MPERKIDVTYYHPYDKGQLKHTLEQGQHALPDKWTKKHQDVEIMFAGDSSHGVFPINVTRPSDKSSDYKLRLVIKPHVNSTAMERELRAHKLLGLIEPKINAVPLVAHAYENYAEGEKKRENTKYRRGWIITRLLEGAVPLLTIGWKNLIRQDKVHILDRLAEYMAFLHSKNVVVGDLKAKNLLVTVGYEKKQITPKNPFPYFYLVDLEKTKIGDVTNKEKTRDIIKFGVNMIKTTKSLTEKEYTELFLKPYQKHCEKFKCK